MSNTKFKPGNSGRPKGAKNKIPVNIRSMVTEFINNNWESVQDEFNRLEPKDKLSFLDKLMNYAIPKLQSINYVDETERLIDGLSDEQLEHVINQLKGDG